MPTAPLSNDFGKDKPINASNLTSGPNHEQASQVFLERDVPLSQSIIWQLQHEFYMQRGVKAWSEDLIPCYITNNPFIAEIYAGIVAGFLCDCTEIGRTGSHQVSRENPLRIVELGAGPGKFSYLFLRHLSILLHTKNIALDTVRYRMTDCSQSSIETWRANSYLAEFVRAGVLEFELLQAGEGSVAGEQAPKIPRASNPMVVIANYVFDSLPQDAFAIKDGQILEVLVTTSTKGKEKPEALTGLQFSYSNAEVATNRYSQRSWNGILEEYLSRPSLSGTTVPFPAQALRTIEGLRSSTDGPMLLLVADKGYPMEDALTLLQGPPTLEFHGANCFSQMVNFDAIGKYFKAIGGEALTPEKHFTSMSICAFLQSGAGDRFPEAAKAYQETQEAFGPDDLFAMLGWLNAHMDEVSVSQALAILRLSRWDPVALMRLSSVLARQARNVVAERVDLRNAVMRTWDNHYPVASSDNVFAFQCGVILLELRFFDDALAMFQESQRMLGRTAATSYNLGLCAQGLGRLKEALAFMTEACTLDSGFEPAKQSRQKLEEAVSQGPV